MKSKLLLSFLLTLFLAVSFVSATVTITSTTPATFSKGLTQTSFSVTNRGAQPINVQISIPTTITDGTHPLTISSPSQLVYSNLAPNQNTGDILLSYSGDTSAYKIGTFTSNIVVNAQNASNTADSYNQTIPLKFLNTFCKYGENGTDLSITSVKINNNIGDDNEWKPFDEIKITMKVENVGDEKVTGVESELGIIDSSGKNIINNMDNLNDKKISLSSITDGKEKTAEYTFTVPSDFDEDTYYVVVKAYKSGKEAELCTSLSDLESSYYETVTGTRESDTEKQVIVSKIVTSPESTAQCGDKVQVSADVSNIGDEDYEDQFKVTMINKELGINQEQIVREDLDQGDSYNVNFDFDVPANVAEKVYILEFKTYYDYDEDDNTYAEVSDRKFTKSITISGNCKTQTSTSTKPVITAELDSETPEAIAGKQVIINSNIKNPGDTSTNYRISVYGNSAWSSLVSIEPESMTVAPGSSQNMRIVLNVDAEAQGEQELTIKATYGNNNELSSEQKVVLTVNQPEVQFGSFMTHLKNNWFIYAIVIVNLVLIIAIIIVIRRMLSPRRDFD